MDVSSMQVIAFSPWIVPVLSVFGSLITLGMVGIFAFIIRKIGDLDKRLISLEKTIASLGTIMELFQNRMHLEDQAEAFGKTLKIAGGSK